MSLINAWQLAPSTLNVGVAESPRLSMGSGPRSAEGHCCKKKNITGKLSNHQAGPFLVSSPRMNLALMVTGTNKNSCPTTASLGCMPTIRSVNEP